MKTIIIIGIIFCVYKIISKLSAESKERKQEEERQRIRDEQAAIRAEQARQREEIKAQIERNKLEVKERIEAEKRRIEWQKRQDAINTRLEKEQERQAAQLAKHEDQLAKMEYESKQAMRDIDHLKERLSQQYAMMDSYLLRQSKMEPGTEAYDVMQKKIITLNNQMHQTRKQYSKAAFVVNDNLRKSRRESA